MHRLSREDFDAVVEYANGHRGELIGMDNKVEERNRREMAEQEAKGIRSPMDLLKPLEPRIEDMWVVVRQRIAARQDTMIVEKPHFALNPERL